MNTKRALISIAILLVIAGIGFGLYYLFFAGNTPRLTVGGDPFGNTGAGPTTDGTGLAPGETATNAGTEVAPNLIKVTNGPVALGSLLINTEPVLSFGSTGSSTTAIQEPADVLVRYIERASGNMYTFSVHSRTLARISNKTLPGIQEASWVPDGSLAYVRFLTRDTGVESVATYALPATEAGGFFLEQNLTQAQVVGSSTIFTLFAGTTGSVGSLTKVSGAGAKTLFTSLLSSLVVYPAERSYFASTKASRILDGYAFTINPGTGTFIRILGPFKGLSILPSPSGKSLLFSYVEAGTYRLSVLDLDTKTVTALPVATLTEKCVWGRSGANVYCAVPTNLVGGLPDSWYQGATAFTDRFWRIDMTARVASLIVDPLEVGKVSIDAVSLSVDAKEDVLVFTDLHTLSLWSYDL
jgi:hypothetical protein